METAKVDIRKLQVLNDRVNQCIEALNQVRLTVHGLSHTSPGLPFGQPGINPGVAFGQPGIYAGLPFGPPGVNPLSQGYLPGLSHSSPMSPFGQPGINPWAHAYQQGFSQVSPFPGASPFIPGAPAFGPMGLSHTSPEESYARPGWADPLLAARIAQTFPYAQYAVPPVVTIY